MDAKTRAVLISAIGLAATMAMDDDDDDLLALDILGKKKRKRDEESDDSEEDDDNSKPNELNHNNNNNRNNTDYTLAPSLKKRRVSTIVDHVADAIPLPDVVVDENKNNRNEFDKPIVLNVGGIHYMTSIQTLIGYNSMLKARFSSKFRLKPCADGSHFIDRDGTLFKHILEYFRNGTLRLPSNWAKQDLLRFYDEIKYYAIDSLFNEVLLKLFDSIIVTNDAIKMKLIRKIMTVTEFTNEAMFLERLSQWKLVYRYDYNHMKLAIKIDGEDQSKFLFNVHRETMMIGRRLLLIQSKNEIFGMYVESADGYYRFSRSFAFNCGDNSFHMIKDTHENKLSFEYFAVRKATEEEVKSEDPDMYTLMSPLYPFVIVYMCTGKINQGTHWLRNRTKEVADDVESMISRLEIWSLPDDRM
eukprot:224843_1